MELGVESLCMEFDPVDAQFAIATHEYCIASICLRSMHSCADILCALTHTGIPIRQDRWAGPAGRKFVCSLIGREGTLNACVSQFSTITYNDHVLLPAKMITRHD